jgi:putative transposase
MEKFKSNNNVIYSCKYNVIFCPKYRRKVLVDAIASRLKELIAQIAVEIKVDILEMEIMPDHVHLLLEVDPQFGIHRVVKRFKGATSRCLRLEFPELKTRLPSLWTNSYFVSTVGGATLETVKLYIQNQNET